LLAILTAPRVAADDAVAPAPFPSRAIDLFDPGADASVVTSPSHAAAQEPPTSDALSPRRLPLLPSGPEDPLPTAVARAIDRLILDDAAVNPLGAGDWREARAAIGAFYAAREFEPIWVDRKGLTAAGHSALSQLRRAAEDGLDLSAFALPADLQPSPPADKLAEAETTIAAAVVTYAEQASGSRILPSRLSPLFASPRSLADPGEALAETAAAPDPAVRLADFNPPQKGYRELRDEMKRLMEAASDRLTFGGGAASAADAGASHARVVGAGADFAAAAGPPEGAARRHQKTGRAVGAYIASVDPALAFRGAARRQSAILANMEMWRWEPRDMGERRIEINVADFSASLLDGDIVVHHARVVVGKPETPTPIFSGLMHYLLINPSWQVPDSIIKKEMLPKLASDPDYLAEHGYEVKTVGGRITVRQLPGEDNALGRIAFMFPNDHSVYMHDTPSRELFDSESRAFSHGCVRVDEALRLAELILGGENGRPAGRISAAIGGLERTVFLTRPLPVHIEYFTEFINESGELRERPDVYGLTRMVAAALSSERQD
jgi:murein L,D-transpeptidase YcbB/YkuD